MRVLASYAPWIGVDLDGTLAHKSDDWKGPEFIGEPIWNMVNHVKRLLRSGETVKVFTARAVDPEAIQYVQDWLENEADLPRLEVTNEKDPGMTLLYDDRAKQVVPNKGIIVE